MARKAAKGARKGGAKKSAASKPAKKAAKKSAGKSPAKSAKKTAKATGGDPYKHLNGAITHTDFASTDPDATKAWMKSALGWKFKPTMQSPQGPYHLFSYSDEGGGGIGSVPPGDNPGSVPYLKVANSEKAYNKAISAGAEGIMPPMTVMPGMRISMVRAPGGVLVGFSGT